MGYAIWAWSQSSGGLNQTPGTELLRSPAVVRIELHSLPAALLPAQPCVSHTMANLPKLELQLLSFLHRLVCNFPPINKHFKDIGKAKPSTGQSSIGLKVAHTSASFIVQQLSH